MDELNLAPLVMLAVGTVVSVVEEIVKFAALAGWSITFSDAFKKWFALSLSAIGAGLSLWIDGTIPSLFITSWPVALVGWLILVTNVLGAIVSVLMLATGLYYVLIKRLGERITARLIQ